MKKPLAKYEIKNGFRLMGGVIGDKVDQINQLLQALVSNAQSKKQESQLLKIGVIAREIFQAAVEDAAEPQWRDVKVGDSVRGKQFSGQGEVVSISELRAPMIHVKLENGNTWAYEAETIIPIQKEE